MGYVPQFRNIDKDYPLSVKNFIQLNAGLFKSKAYKQSVHNIIQETNLAGIQNSSMGELSGGEKQRAYLAQALIDNPDFIILDESTASLDPNAKLSLMNLVKQLNKKNETSLFYLQHMILSWLKNLRRIIFLCSQEVMKLVKSKISMKVGWDVNVCL